MDNNTIIKRFYVTEEEYAYLKKIKKERKLPSASSALRIIIEEHAAGNKTLTADDVWTAFEKKYDNILTRMRLGINTADRNSQIIIKMLNSLVLENGLTLFTDEKETESIYLSAARDAVKSEIEHYKQLKDERERKNAEKE